MLIFDQLKKSDPRLRLVAAGVLSGILLLAAGLWYHQVLSARHYVETLRSQSFRTVRVPAIRGKILDRNGTPLAENSPNYKVNLYLDELRPEFEREFDRQKISRLAAKQLHGTPPPKGFFATLLARLKGQSTVPRLTRDERDALNRQVRHTVVSDTLARVGAQLGLALSITDGDLQRHYLQRRAMPLTLVANMTFAQVAAFQERAATAPGLDLDIQPVRVYPHKAATAHVLGFLKRDDSSAEDEESYFDYRLPDFRGVLGIEGGLDSHLRGRAGVRAMMVNNLGYRQSDEIWSAAEAGGNIVLTLDLPLQTAAWKALRAQGLNARGAVVVMDAANGDVLAMVSSPGYDANTFFPSPSPQENARLQDEDLKPTMNRATQEARYYAPGSIFKIVTGIAALEAGLNPDETFRVAPNPADPARGIIHVGKRPIKDMAPPGEYNFRRAFIKSSNAYFVKHGLDARMDAIRRVAERLHLGERTGLPLMQESKGIFPTRDWVLQNRGGGWSDGDTANIAIGQGDISVTPIQMTVMTAAVANGGKVFWPRIVDRIEPQDLAGNETEIRFAAARVRDELGVSPRTIEIVRDAMFADVEDPSGTGRAAAVPGVRVGGKTGTAQVPVHGRIEHTTWFASFGEHQGRLYAVVVMIETGVSGGGTSAPIAQQIYQAIRDRDSLPGAKPRQLAGGAQ